MTQFVDMKYSRLLLGQKRGIRKLVFQGNVLPYYAAMRFTIVHRNYVVLQKSLLSLFRELADTLLQIL